MAEPKKVMVNGKEEVPIRKLDVVKEGRMSRREIRDLILRKQEERKNKG